VVQTIAPINNRPTIENQPAPRGAFNEGRHTGAGAIKSRKIFRENVKPVPESPTTTALDFGGHKRKF
jgi:hypothetical protein